MAKTLTIAGQNFLPQYVTSSAQITETAKKSNRMTMKIRVGQGQSFPREGSETVFKDGSRFLFAGYISQTKPEELGIEQVFMCDVEVSDYSYIFNSKVARRSYASKTLKYIVEDLLDTYVSADYAFTTTNVLTGPTIDSINFDHISIRKCFEKLAKLTGYVWFVDYEKNLYFQTVSTTAAPEDITDAGLNHENLSIAYDTSQVRNSVIVIGRSDGEASANSETETFYGDGETRSWELSSQPSSVISITLNSVSKQFSLDVNERDTDVFVYSFSGSSFRLTDSQTTPVGGGTPDEIVITYYPRVPIIAQELDSESIAFFAALDGGDGKMEYTIKDSSVTTKEEATARALQELEQYATPLVDGRFITRTSLLQPSSIFAAGQYVTVNSPVNEIDDDTAFLIQEVKTTLNETADETEYIYQVRFGGRIVGIQEFLESLASEEGDVTNADMVITIESTSDLVVFDDDAPTNELFTPPFKYGPSDIVHNSTLSTDLVSYWKLDEASGTRTDSHGSNDLTDNGSVPGVTGKIEDGADLEASSSQYLSITDASQAGLDFASEFSISLWAKLESLTSTMTLVSKKDTSNVSFYFRVGTGSITFSISGDGTAASASASAPVAQSTGVWYHYVITYKADPRALRIYRNGSSYASTTLGTGPSVFDGTAPFVIGAELSSGAPINFFDGIIDEVGAWSRELTSTEIAWLYNSGDGRRYSSTQARWNMAEWS